MKKISKLVVVITLFTSVAALLYWAFSPHPIAVEISSVTRGHFETTIEEDGKTRVRDRYIISAPLTGRLERIRLREGDAVGADAVVAQLTPVLSPMLDARSLSLQTAAMQTADAVVNRAQAHIARAKVALEQTRNELGRSEKLAKDGFVSATKLETDRLAVIAAARELDSASQERHVAVHELDQARAALMAINQPISKKQLDSFALHAPIAGTVLHVLQASESSVALGTPLLEIGNTSNLEIVAQLLTTDALQIPPHAPVRIERWGGTGELVGRVRMIEPGAFTKISALGVEEQRVNVLIDITSPVETWKALGDGYRVSVRIVTLAQENVLCAPVAAIFPLQGQTSTTSMAAFLYAQGHARLIRVQIGARNGDQAWITAGLSAGQQLIIYPPTAVADGARVAVRRVSDQ
jgi:HlyD family secretion protein